MNIAEQSEVDKKATKVRDAKASRALVIRTLCEHKDGRDFLWFLMEQGSPFASSMRFDAQERSDPMRTAYAEGWRGLGTLIMGEIMDASPEGYVRMLTENRNVKIMENRNGSSSND